MEIIQITEFDQLNDASVLRHIPGIGMVWKGGLFTHFIRLGSLWLMNRG